MSPRAKKLLVWAVVIFFIYMVIKTPEQAADLVNGVWDFVAAAASAVGRFFDALLAG